MGDDTFIWVVRKKKRELTAGDYFSVNVRLPLVLVSVTPLRQRIYEVTLKKILEGKYQRVMSI